MTPESPSHPPSSPRAQHADRNVRLDPQGIYGTRSARRQNQLRRRRQFQNSVLWTLGAVALLSLGRWLLQPRRSVRSARASIVLPFHPAGALLPDQNGLLFTSQSGGLWRAKIGLEGAPEAPRRLWSTAFAPGAQLLVTPSQIFWPGGDGTLSALDFGSGRPQWSATLPSALVATPALARTGNRGLLVAGDDAGNLAAFDSLTGAAKWKKALGGAIGAGIGVLEAPPSPPSGSTAAPSGSTTAPSGSTTAPSGSTAAPSGLAPPGNGSAPPGNGLAPPGNGLAPPGNGLAPPGNEPTAALNGAAPVASRLTSRGAVRGAGFLVPLMAGPATRGGLVCLDARTGAERWRFPGDARSQSSGMAMPIARGNRVFWCNDEGAVVCLDGASGRKIWKRFAAPLDPRSNQLVMLRAAPAIVAGVLVVGGNDGVVRGLDLQSGATRWTRELGGAVRFGAQSLNFEGKSALLVTGEVPALWVLDAADGTVLRRWSTPYPNSFGATSVAKNAYALDADGHLQIAPLD